MNPKYRKEKRIEVHTHSDPLLLVVICRQICVTTQRKFDWLIFCLVVYRGVWRTSWASEAGFETRLSKNKHFVYEYKRLILEKDSANL